jgi:hypothetical protein
MYHRVLTLFPERIHPLTLVSDVDGVLADEELRTVLIARGFQLVAENDPVALRYAIQRLQPFSGERPVIVITDGPLDALPYDLWQQSYHVTLSLAELFPGLAESLVRQLSTAQRRRLGEALVDETLTYGLLKPAETALYILNAVFDIAPNRWLTPEALISWLDAYHDRVEPLPNELCDSLLQQLRRLPTFTDWPLANLIDDRAALAAFTERRGLAMPGIIREHGIPLEHTTTRSSQHQSERDRRVDLEIALADVERGISGLTIQWTAWQGIAWSWARATVIRYRPDGAPETEQIRRYNTIRNRLDERFLTWLQSDYMPLAGRALPTPHHLHHVPRWLAHQRESQPGIRHALLVLDGMSLGDWMQIRAVWEKRHPSWTYTENLVLAQIPSVTAISRQALISGRPPRDFADSLTDNRQEPRAWGSFWQHQGLPVAQVSHHLLPDRLDAEYPSVISSRRTQELCLVSSVIDDMVHGATQGAADQQATLQVWLQPEAEQVQRSGWIEALIQHLFDLGYTVVVTSDHGHTEAVGVGQPREGVLVISRSKRARIYQNLDVAHEVQAGYPDTILWRDDGLLPSGVYALLPRGREAFVTAGSLVVSHGGLTIDEMVVPLVTIARS